jgi:hypothetical protein
MPHGQIYNPVDYHICDTLVENVYCGRCEKLTEVISQCWENISLAEIKKFIASWKTKLRAVCSENWPAPINCVGGTTKRFSPAFRVWTMILVVCAAGLRHIEKRLYVRDDIMR